MWHRRDKNVTKEGDELLKIRKAPTTAMQRLSYVMPKPADGDTYHPFQPMPAQTLLLLISSLTLCLAGSLS